MLNTELSLIEFSTFDRCDGCGAQAYSLARREDMTELLFCIHHRKRHRDALLNEGWEVIDGTEALEMLAENEGIPV